MSKARGTYYRLRIEVLQNPIRFINILLYGGRIVAAKFVAPDFGNVILLERERLISKLSHRRSAFAFLFARCFGRPP